MFSRWSACLGLTALLFANLAGFAGTTPRDFPPLNFPDVEGYDKGEVHEYGGGAGKSIPYNSKDGVVVTIYIYNRGLTKIPNGVSDDVRKDMKGAKAAIKEAEKQGLYTKATELGKEEEVTLGKNGPKALRASFEIAAAKGDSLSDIYITGYQNYFIKIRCTRPKNTAEKTKPSMERLVSKLGDILAK
jgi:hypothetical protein